MFVQLFSEMLQVLGGLIVFYFVYIYYKKHDDKPATDTPSMAQTALRELVERAVDEARKLPGLGESVSATAQNTVSIDEQSYEDLLATAILNKVVEKYQKEYLDDNSNVLSDKLSRARKHVKNKSDENVNEDELDSFESMSPDECNNDCSGNKMKKRQDSLSLTIEEQIEEVTTLYTSDEDQGCMKTNVFNFQCARRVPFPEFGMDIIDPSQESSDDSHDETDDGSAHVDHITPVESWEENWLFQKKKISIQSDPVTMLVPNPSADYRALIGDKDADDTSDLSEFSAHSDDEVEDELIEAINSVIPKSSLTDNIAATAKVDRKPTVIKDNKYDDDVDKAHSDTDKIVSSIENTENNSSNGGLIDVDKSTFNISINSNTTTFTSIDGKNNREDNNNKFINSELNHVELVSSNLNYLKNDEMPKTPAPSPMINSFCENDLTSTESCGLEKLNEKLKSINGNIEEPIEILRDRQDVIINSKTHLTSEFLEQEKIYENNLQLSSPPRPGTIAEREHKKWENAPPIENNPYSQENIQKRLLERQYSRRSSDVNGNSAVLPTTPCSSLQIVIGANRPDIKRFGRDYYINESKSPTGERLNLSGTSISSRPSSSLSHHSNSTSSDFEQQVSHGLDTFEESSLRGSLQRRTYRGTNVTSHFVINPLIHMDISDEIEYNKHYIDPNDEREFDKSSNMTSCEMHQDNSNNAINWYGSVNNFDNFDTNSSHYFKSNFSQSTINPLYDDENELMQKFIGDTIVDRDSGMYSTDSNEFESFKIENNSTEENHSVKINCYNNNNNNNNLYKINENQIYIVNGKKYWLLNSQIFHTFGGIKRRRIKIDTDDDLYDADNDDFSNEHLTNIDTDFSKFKFQTFGGIKYRNKIDRMRNVMHKKIRARPSIKLFTNATKHSMKTNDRYFSTPSERSLKRAILDDRDNLKLEPPLEPIIIEKKFTSLSDMRKRRHHNANTFPVSEQKELMNK